LQKRLNELRLHHLGDLPPEIGVRDLLLLALEHHWIVEEPSGRLHIQVSEEALA
jgi:hypothetical protein